MPKRTGSKDLEALTSPTVAAAQICCTADSAATTGCTAAPETTTSTAPGTDLLRGGRGLDVLLGGPGPDLLRGDLGRDQQIGGSGNDYLRARDGWRDALNGGPGIDRATTDPLDIVIAVERR